MAQLEGIHIQNYRALRDIALGPPIEATYRRGTDKPAALPRMLAVIGPNGSGKSSIMDALGFLGDCLNEGVEEACDKPHRGGFERLRTKGIGEPIKLEVYYRQEAKARPISYSLHIDLDAKGVPSVVYERLRQRRKGLKRGQPFSFLELTNGVGPVWNGEASETKEGNEKISVRLSEKQQLGITSLGNLSEHPRIVAFREFLKGWYLSYFVPDLARGRPMAGAQKHLTPRGDNLANYVQYMERAHPERFKGILERIAQRIPGVQKIEHIRTEDSRLLLRFNERGYVDPFYAGDMSDGTLKMFAYMMLIEDTEPAPLIGIEEPENGLHHQLLEPLAREMKKYASKPGGPQILLTTHSPYFVDALRPEEVWILEKGEDGYSTVIRAADISNIKEMCQEGIPLGSLWYSNHFGRGNP